jgi:hypothetical protein
MLGSISACACNLHFTNSLKFIREIFTVGIFVNIDKIIPVGQRTSAAKNAARDPAEKFYL